MRSRPRHVRTRSPAAAPGGWGRGSIPQPRHRRRAEVTGLPGVPEDTLPSTPVSPRQPQRPLRLPRPHRGGLRGAGEPFRRPEGVLCSSPIPPLPTSPRLPLGTHTSLLCAEAPAPIPQPLLSLPVGEETVVGTDGPSLPCLRRRPGDWSQGLICLPCPGRVSPPAQPRSAAPRGGGGGGWSTGMRPA